MNAEWGRNDLIDLHYAITNGQGYKSGGDADKKTNSQKHDRISQLF